VGSPVPALNILVAVLADSGYALLIGALLAASWLGVSADLGESAVNGVAADWGTRLHRLKIACVVVLVTAHLVRPWFVASSMSGATQFREVLALVPTILTSTRQGGLWYANSAALTMLVAAQFFRSGRGASAAAWIEIAALCALAASKAASSHASEEGDFTLAEISQFLHLLATSVWAGAIVVSGLFVVPRLAVLAGASALWIYGGRLSKTVTWALGVLVLSGLYISWRDMHGAITSLWTTSWGKILVTKAVFVAFAVLLGSLTRFRCLGHPPSGRRAYTMTKLIRSEAAVMAGILCLSGVLANTGTST
jgi:copper resistance protein D